MNNVTRFGAFLSLVSGLVLLGASVADGDWQVVTLLGGMAFLVGLVCLHAGLAEDLRRGSPD